MDEICEIIISKTTNKSPRPYEYSNSGFVLLSKIIEIVKGRNYSEVISSFYNSLSIEFTFDSGLSNYLSGWGDGAIVSSVDDYLKFIRLDTSYDIFSSLTKNLKFFSGGVPGYDTLVCFGDDFELVFFSSGSQNEGIVDQLLNIIEQHWN